MTAMKLQWKINRKSYMPYRMTPLQMTLSDLEGHLGYVKHF